MDYFVVIVESGRENEVVEGVGSMGMIGRCFYVEEMRNIKHKKSVTKVLVQKPRWPGYLFVGIGEKDRWVELKGVRGVYGVLGVMGYPVRMREWQFVAMEKRILGMEEVVAGDGSVVMDGMDVKITDGAFEGHIGVFRNKNVELIIFGKVARMKIDPKFLAQVG